MRRRDFISLLGGAATWPFAARAQQPEKTFRVGLLSIRSAPALVHEPLWSTLRNFGYVEGRNLTVERRFAAGDLTRLPSLADELVRLGVDVIVTETTPAALAAKRATTVIPIVMATGGDAVGSGLVMSLARPGGNVTGMSFVATELGDKRVQILKELVPHATQMAFLGNSAIPTDRLAFEQMKVAGQTIGVTVEFVNAPTSNDLESAFAEMARMRLDAVSVSAGAAYTEHGPLIASLAARHRLPASFLRREYVDVGGLVSYGPSFGDLFRRTASYVGKILKGAKPADLPVEQPTKFELVINLKTAQALGLEVPPTLLARADEVIE
jgi:ABC-type uncharacterized transport system substrate-binding protein